MSFGRSLSGILLLLATVTNSNALKCNRMIPDTTEPRSSAVDKYHFFMTLYNHTDIIFTYMPNTRYTVNIVADSIGPSPRKFTRFLISSDTQSENENADSGTFDIIDDSLVRFAENCANAVIETSMVPKEKVTVIWTSPSEGSGCILIRATILETPDTWYMDDANLVLNVCQDTKVEADDQGPILPECCACDEAKYEVTFEGLWSRNTHPKDFPSKGWLIRFSDVIGASHTVDYRFWTYDGMASIGLKQVAELGSTRRLESELKNQSEHIRTIIKARGISYPNVTGRTFAVFRVDRKHHLMSLVSMIDPSPDWIVGVSGLELCSNCSWIEHKELNLYPYDVGTDSGITYVSPDSPTEPQELIHRITTTYPNDSRSPFYDPTRVDMKPLARLYLNRQRLYEKTCEGSSNEGTDPGVRLKNKFCRVTPWGNWTSCSVNCGKGYKLRQRKYRDEDAATLAKCNVSLTDREECYSGKLPCDNLPGEQVMNDKCATDEWSNWSSCSSTCGYASKTRSRNLKNRKYKKICTMNGPQFQQTMECENLPCPGEDADEVRNEANDFHEDNDENGTDSEFYEDEQPEVEKCPPDRYTQWSIWTPCSSSCGPGVKLRSRLVDKDWRNLKDIEEDQSLEECKVQQTTCIAKIPTCDFSIDEAEKICSEPVMKGQCEGNILRAYFDKHSGRCRFFSYSGCDGNRNNFQTEQDCNKVCGSYQKKLKEFKGIQIGSQVVESSESREISVDCQVSKWSNWTACLGCRGYSISTRRITVPSRGSGKPCPQKLLRKRKCRKMEPCLSAIKVSDQRFSPDKSSVPDPDYVSVNCKVTPWSSWSRCTATCGAGLQQRTRTIKIKPSGLNGRLCPALVEFRKCITLECE